MNNKKIIVFCPNPYSLYTNSVCELLIRKGYTIEAIVVRKFTLSRFKNEFSRDGKRLLKKIWKKLILRGKSYSSEETSTYNIGKFRTENNLTVTNIKYFQENLGTKIIPCETLNDIHVERFLSEIKEKLVIFTGGGIIRKNILNVAGDGIINCHMGILPRYKGMDLPEWCILENKVEELGLTLHFMDTGIDTGHILKTITIPLSNSRTIKNLRERFEPVMVDSMVETATGYLNGTIIPKPQPSSTLNRQYFIVHPRLYELVNLKISKIQQQA